MIDEYRCWPAAARAQGTTCMLGLAELRAGSTPVERRRRPLATGVKYRWAPIVWSLHRWQTAAAGRLGATHPTIASPWRSWCWDWRARGRGDRRRLADRHHLGFAA
jgi:hypothetical protein